MGRVYIAGPMRGIPFYNHPAFDAAEKKLHREGFATFNPARRDRENGLDLDAFPSDYDWSQLPPDFDLEGTIRADVDVLLRCTCIYMLPGWRSSQGAVAEHALAKWRYLTVIEEHAESVLAEAERLTSTDRQAQYGPPDQDFSRTAAMWSALFGTHFNSADVAMAMICLKLSRETHQEKRDNWTDIAGYAKCGAICRGVN